MSTVCNSQYFESVLNVKVPTMTSNTEPNGEVSVSHENNQGIQSQMSYNAFNDSGTWTYQISNNYETTTFWIQYRFDKSVVVNKVYISISSILKNMTFSGSDDGTIFETIGMIQNTSEDDYYNIQNHKSYKVYRLSFTGYNYEYNFTKYAHINRLQFYGREKS